MIEGSARGLLSDLIALRGFGGVGSGVVGTACADIDMKSGRWLVE